MKHLISTTSIDRDFLYEVFLYADLEEELFNIYQDALKSKILITLFWENSLRTELSFKSSFIKLGGSCLDYKFDNGVESLDDSLRHIGDYCDIIVARSKDGTHIKKLQNNSSVSVISAGEAKIEHPTTAIGEAYMINKYYNKLDNLNILFFGYLPNRGFQSLYLLLNKNFKNNNFHIITPNNTIDTIFDNKKNTVIIKSFDEYLKNYDTNDIDIIYMGESKYTYDNLDIKDTLYFDKSMLKYFKKDVYITHNLPIQKILDRDIDTLDNAIYMKRSKYTQYIRAGIFLKYFHKSSPKIKDK